jgi:hypothetical protein
MNYKNLQIKGIKLDTNGRIIEMAGIFKKRLNLARELKIDGVC